MLNPAQTEEWEDITSKVTWNTTYVPSGDLKVYANSKGLVRITGYLAMVVNANTETVIGTISDTSLTGAFHGYRSNTVGSDKVLVFNGMLITGGAILFNSTSAINGAVYF